MDFREIARDIKELRIQGATNVAKYSFKAMIDFIKKYKGKDFESFIHDFRRKREYLESLRVTEPLQRNALRWLEFNLMKCESVDEAKELGMFLFGEFMRMLDEAMRRIEVIGARLLKGKKVITYCHSSTVVSILKRARAKVICCETRPKYQGRITARELARAGLKVKFIVDSALSSYVKECDAALVGCDAICADGSIVNKIGTFTLALACEHFEVPFYVAGSLLKYNPETRLGYAQAIEHRDPKEVWRTKLRIKIENPAFDVTPAHFIKAIICESGVIPPQLCMSEANRLYPWIVKLI